VREEGVDLREGAKVSKVEKAGDGVRVTVEAEGGAETIDGSVLLVAAGRKPNLDGLGLEMAGIAYDRRGITVNCGLRTSNRRVYAIGDVAGGFQFTHVAGYHAGLVIRSILFRLPVRENRDIIPWATYTDPELAQVGLTEAGACERYGDGIRVLTWPFHDNDRAQAERETRGKVKVVTTKRGRIVGATIVGAGAGETISLYALAISQKLKISAFTGFVAPYPTRAEITKRVAVTYFTPSLTNPWIGRIISLLRRLG
ncbi:MAG: FAD-dependent oxidoreductase, partial [Hyphomicrobiales bacterium]|nr:FAD-dependent oxidoreductase [Hyphomicrobiales bacterium]